MVAPGTHRPGKYGSDKGFGGVIQVHVTRACNLSCYACTQASNVEGPYPHITPENFEAAVKSLAGYPGVVGVFGGNPAMHPQFVELCATLRKHVPWERCGLWCNDLFTREKAAAARETFNPRVSNLNVHLSQGAYNRFRFWWPESQPFGLHEDSRHAPVYVAMRDVLRTTCNNCSGSTGYYDRPNGERYLSDPEDGTEWQRCDECDGVGHVYDESRAWELISGCSINRHWSAMVGQFRGEVRAWFCEIAGAQAMLHQDDPDYPDTGLDPTHECPPGSGRRWWQLPMGEFREQVRKHCHECSVPLNGYGELSQSADPDAREQVSATHADVYRPKRKGRAVEVVTTLEQLGMGRITKLTDYLGNARR
jgi:hypothetical protein